MMRREIGSEFWDVPLGECNSVFPSDTKWFVSGRSALKAIINENKFSKVAIPFWCCDSMIKPFIESGIDVVFYENEPIEADAILVMDYFGYTTRVTYSDYPGIVIRDITHSIFSNSYKDADYTFGSLRKWAGFLTGGFVLGLKKTITFSMPVMDYVALRKKAMYMKKKYITGDVDSKEYLDWFSMAENYLENVGVAEADENDIKRARCLDVSFIKSKRRENASILMEEFRNQLIFSKLGENDCPLFVPIRVENRNELRRLLIENEVYCPVHWPISDYHQLTAKQEQMYNSEISLVCDQRYTIKDMERIVELVKKFEHDGGRL